MYIIIIIIKCQEKEVLCQSAEFLYMQQIYFNNSKNKIITKIKILISLALEVNRISDYLNSSTWRKKYS